MWKRGHVDWTREKSAGQERIVEKEGQTEHMGEAWLDWPVTKGRKGPVASPFWYIDKLSFPYMRYVLAERFRWGTDERIEKNLYPRMVTRWSKGK